MRSLLIAGFLIAFGLVLVGQPTAASADPVLQVVAVDVKDGMADEYAKRVMGAQAVIDRLGIKSTMRIWQASLAGQNAGTVVVGIEYPSLATFAEATDKLAADAEWQKVIAGLGDIRTIVSNSLYREITP